MPKPPPKHEPDPMARVVDRLLAQLPGLHTAPESQPPIRSSSAAPLRIIAAAPRFNVPTVGGLWGRVALVLALAIMIVGWPYFRACGLPLIGYLFAVAALLLAGGWTAVLAWELRNASAHVVSLMLLLWGLVLGAGEILPRTGYAADGAAWECVVPDGGPSWMKWFAAAER